MKKIKPINDPKVLCPYCDPAVFKFETTAELEDLPDFIGQSRALQAMQFGMRIPRSGYNLYVLGPPGVGKRTVVRHIVAVEASHEEPPADWCYVNNFENPLKPNTIKLPFGTSNKFRHDMESLIEDLTVSIPAIFETEEFRSQMQKIADDFSDEQEKLLKNLEMDAKKHQLSILSTQQGFIVTPTKDNKALSQEEFDQLPIKERQKKEELINKFTDRLSDILKIIPRLQKERRKKERAIQKEFTMTAVGNIISEFKKKYKDIKAVYNYLDAVQRDVVNNVKDFLRQTETNVNHFTNTSTEIHSPFTRYQVNIIVDHLALKGAPVIYEDNPTYNNLIGRIEYASQYGNLVTNFSLIRGGALHRANGGYLMLDAEKLLLHHYAWEGLKRALYARKIIIEAPTQVSGFINTVSLEPEPIPLNVKIILIGDRHIYYSLCQYDPEFADLFKVAVDFNEEIERTPANLQLYAKLIATIARQSQLNPFHRSAVARIIEFSARIVGDIEKLSLNMRSISDLLREANYYSQIAGKKIVDEADVTHAIQQNIFRSDRIQHKIYENINRRRVLIVTEGKRIGQINGLTIVQLGDFTFGHPAKITAITRMGKGDVIDIQREANLSGDIHTKAVLTLTGFFNGRYARDYHLALTASLVFEQIYHVVDGDSASLAELCAILSSLAETPIEQSFAITGSVNQYGEVQPVGGINEKIEGFFSICQFRGLTGKHGVLIPAVNIDNLVLRAEVVTAINNKEFFIYPVRTVDEAMQLLCNLPAGERNKKGRFPAKTINHRVEMKLRQLAQARRKH